jgi:hypothetical protein
MLSRVAGAVGDLLDLSILSIVFLVELKKIGGEAGQDTFNSFYCIPSFALDR